MTADIRDYGAVKGNLEIHFLDGGRNAEFLKTHPHHRYAGFTGYYRVALSDADRVNGKATMAVTDGALEVWGITPDRLREDALAAERARDDVVFTPLMEQFRALTLKKEPENLWLTGKQAEPEDGMPLYILTRDGNVGGAGVIARPEVQERIAEILKDDYVILPSSIPELIIVPESCGIPPRQLAGIVKTVNADEGVIKEEDVLSDKVHYYSRQEKAMREARIPEGPEPPSWQRKPKLKL